MATMNWREQLEQQQRQRVVDRLWRQRQAVETPQGAQVRIGSRNLINFCSNDYLGLANHPLLIDAANAAASERGTGSGASHLICGHSDRHQQLETDIAAFVGSESALLFSTGYMANLAIPQTFLNAQDLLLQDRLNHASLIDAGRLASATTKRFPHGDADALKRRIDTWKQRQPGGHAMVMTDGVFSMDGDVAPIPKYHSLIRDIDGLLVVDDAHGLGVLGANGVGSLEFHGIRPTGPVLIIGTLGKALGSFGAFVAGDRVLIEHLIQFGRTYIYTTALPPQVVAATAAALKLISGPSDLRRRLMDNIDRFEQSLAGPEIPQAVRSALEGPLQRTPKTPIFPMLVGSSQNALAASALLRQRGLLVSAIRPPTVPPGGARLRITLTAAHCPEDIRQLVSALCDDVLVSLLEPRPAIDPKECHEA